MGRLFDSLREGREGTEFPSDRDGRSEPESQLFGQFIETVPDPVIVVTESGRIMAGNDDLGELFGWELSDLVNEQLRTLFPDISPDAIEENCGAGAGEYVACRGVKETGDDLWVESTFDRQRLDDRTFIVGTVRDVTARHEREQILEQYERIVETIEDGVYTLDESFTIETVNNAIGSMTGYDEEELVGASATVLADESTIVRATELSQALLAGKREAATLTTEIETADGETLPVETRFSTYSMDDGQYRQVGVLRDISNRRRFERTLTALHDSTRELIEAQTTSKVSELVVDSATEVLDITGAAIYRFDTTEHALCPISVSGGVTDRADTDSAIEAGNGPLWQSFIENERMPVGAEDHPFGDSAADGGICLPLGEYGVLYVATDGGVGEHDADTLEVLDLLAANAVAALERVDREQTLRNRDDELRERNSRLRQLEEVNAIIRRIDRVLVDADTCTEIEQAVCDQLAASKWISFAWIGRVGVEKLERRAWAGAEPSYLDSVSQSMVDAGGPPAVRTARDETMTVVPSIADGLQSENWRAKAVAKDFRSVLSVPLKHDDFTYGVLTVYGAEQSAFGEMLQSVFSELGETIANAIQEVESRQRRSATTVMELEVSLSIPVSPLGQIAERIGAQIVCEGVVPEAGDVTRLFFTVAAADGTVPASSVSECGAELTRVESLTAITEEGSGLFEAVVSGRTVAQTLVDEGARTISIEVDADGEGAVATVLLSAGVDVRKFIERLEERYREARLLARRERDVADRTPGGTRATAEGKLTDRQRQVLRTAYLSGYFDWPRNCSGQELADRLDISQPTLSRHLRVGERKLFEWIFEEAGR